MVDCSQRRHPIWRSSWCSHDSIGSPTCQSGTWIFLLPPPRGPPRMNSAAAQEQPSSSAPAQTAGMWPLLWEYRLGYIRGREAAIDGSWRAVKASSGGRMTDDQSTWEAQMHAKKLSQAVVEAGPIRADMDVLRRDGSAPTKALGCWWCWRMWEGFRDGQLSRQLGEK